RSAVAIAANVACRAGAIVPRVERKRVDLRGAGVDRVLVAYGQPEPGAEPVVRREELLAVADVEPALAEAERVDRLVLPEPADEVPRLVRRVALAEITVEEGQMLAVEDVGRGRGQRGGRSGRLLDERDDAAVVVDFDDPVPARELDRAHVADGD